jgi:pimeloyl-ACP methyl ester carboxylesterase
MRSRVRDEVSEATEPAAATGLLPEPGFVLIHGAMLGGWIWERLEPLLNGPALAVDLPGRGSRPADLARVTLRDAVDSVLSDVEELDSDRVVLVAHSLGGILVPALIERLGDRVVQTVYVGAVVPTPGEAYLDVLPTADRLFLRLILRIQRKGPITPAWAARRALCNDLDEATTRRVAERLTREIPRLYSDPVTGGRAPDVPSLYIRLTRDQAVSAAMQDQSIERLAGVRVESLDAGHLPMLGQPERVAAVLNRVAG